MAVDTSKSSNLTYWGRDKTAIALQTFPGAFSSVKSLYVELIAWNIVSKGTINNKPALFQVIALP